MELLKRIVREDHRIHLLGDLKNERVSATHGTGRGGDHLARSFGVFKPVSLLFGLNAVLKGCVYDDN